MPAEHGGRPDGGRRRTSREAAGRSGCTPPTTRPSRAPSTSSRTVNREVPFAGLRWFFDHAETISPRNIERVKRARGRHRHPAPHGLPGRVLRRALRSRRRRRARRPSGGCWRWACPSARGPTPRASPATTRSSRSTGWSPGRRSAGPPLYAAANRLDRMEALRLWTVGSAWFSGEEDKKGALAPGQLADLAVLSADYFSVPEEEIKGLESVLTIVGGNVSMRPGSSPRSRRRPSPQPLAGHQARRQRHRRRRLGPQHCRGRLVRIRLRLVRLRLLRFLSP